MNQVDKKRQPDAAPQSSYAEASNQAALSGGLRESAVGRLRLLWERRQFLIRAAVVGLLAGTLLALLLPKRFESTTRLMPPDTQSGSGAAMLAALTTKTGVGIGSLAGNLLGIQNSGALFIGILRSRTVGDRLVDRFNLKQIYGSKLEENARQRLEENTSISEDLKSGIISITVTDHDPKRAAAIAQGYVEELNQLVAELSTSSAHRERVFLEGRLAAVKQALDQASQEFSQFASKNLTIDITDQGRAMVGTAADVMGQLIAAESELKGLEEIYTSNNVRVRSVQGRITELRKQLNALGGNEATVTSTPGTVADTSYPSIRKLPLLGVKYADLYRQTKIEEAVYESLTQEYELAKVEEAKETPSVKVLDAAIVPEKKSFPPRLTIMFLCTFLAFASAAVLLLGKARWEESDPHAPGKVLMHEVFRTVNASMPWAPPNGSRVQSMAHQVWAKLVWRHKATTSREDEPQQP